MIKQSLLAAVAGLAVSAAASANVIAGWTMPTAIPSGTTGTSYNYGAADQGDVTGGTMLSGFHTNAATTWSSPAGNGSPFSFSSNTWSVGDFYQVTLSTTGYNNISLSWDQTRSSTGPSVFDCLVSYDGGQSFLPVSLGYTVIQAGASGSGTNAWNSTTYQSAFTTKILVPSAANQGSVLFRWVNTSAVAVGGTNRIDNIFISGDAVPAPGALALLGLAAFAARRRR